MCRKETAAVCWPAHKGCCYGRPLVGEGGGQGRGTAAAKVSSIPAPRNALFTRPPTSAPDPVKLKALYLPERRRRRRRRRTIPRAQKRVDGARIKSTTRPLAGPGRTGRGEKMAYFHAGLYARRQCMSPPPPLPPSPCSPTSAKGSCGAKSRSGPRDTFLLPPYVFCRSPERLFNCPWNSDLVVGTTLLFRKGMYDFLPPWNQRNAFKGIPISKPAVGSTDSKPRNELAERNRNWLYF